MSEVVSMQLRIPGAWLLAVGMMAAVAAGPRPAWCEAVEPGDVLQIEVYAGGEKQNDFSATVSTDRTITCPLVGSIPIGSGDTADIAAALREALARDYFVDPQVLVTVKQHGAKIYVLGEVKHPGVYLLSDGPTLLGACALAGGFTDFADPHHVRIARAEDGKVKFISVDLLKAKAGKAEDVRLRGGDRLEIPHRLF
jgi:polysaccharide export outer membrane protein